jgi:hypothetical protein
LLQWPPVARGTRGQSGDKAVSTLTALPRLFLKNRRGKAPTEIIY